MKVLNLIKQKNINKYKYRLQNFRQYTLKP